MLGLNFRIFGNIDSVISAKCHYPTGGQPLMKWHVDPLKFVVNLPAHDNLVYVAVISEDIEGHFKLHDVYQQQQHPPEATFTIVQPRRYSYICT